MSERRIGYVGVGSNIDPHRNIPSALTRLAEQVTVTAVSTFYRTVPLDRPDQPLYANGVFGVETLLEPRQFKQLLCAVEVTLGRRRGGDRHAPRTIDLDLLLLGDLVLDDDRFRLPDPDICRRPFISTPLMELAPELRLPDTGERLADLAPRPSALTPDAPLTAALRAALGTDGPGVAGLSVP